LLQLAQERRAFMASCSSSGLKSRNPISGVDRQVKNGAPFCVTTRRTFLHDGSVFYVPPIGFDLLYAFVIVGLAAEPGLDQRHNRADGGMDRAPTN
jgi:hypothetical protein